MSKGQGKSYPMLVVNPEPAVFQYMKGSIYLTFNPDDEMFYIYQRGHTLGRRKDYRNAMNLFKELTKDEAGEIAPCEKLYEVKSM